MINYLRHFGVACLIIAFSTGCQATRPCPSITHVDEEVRVEVSEDGDAFGKFAGRLINFNGQSLSDIIDGDASLTAAERRELEKAALKAAKENIAKASEWICSACTVEQTCQAYTTDQTKLTLKRIDVIPQSDGGWKAVVIFKLEGEFGCGKCDGPTCQNNPEKKEIEAKRVINVEEVPNLCTDDKTSADPVLVGF